VLTDERELRRSLRVFVTSLVSFPPPPGDEKTGDFFEPGRTLGAFVDGELVGTASSLSGWINVPGGARVPQAMVTDVGVLPTHTRRGLARALITHQLEQIAARGEPIATLRATEAVIYERFGYGIASSAADLEVTVARARFRPGLPAGGPVRMLDPEQAWAVLPGIYAPLRRPGGIGRSRYWWRQQELFAGRAGGARQVVVHGPVGAEDGFARYQPQGQGGSWHDGPEHAIVVNDFVAHTERARLGLLRYLLSIDLVSQLKLTTVPVDHGLEKLLLDERAVRTTALADETWLRLIDVPAALAARAYQGPGSVVLDVNDELLPANTGRYSVSAGGVERTEAAAQLSLDVAALAAVYLGGTRWWQLALAGRVIEREDGALAAADRLFAADRQPYAGTMF